MKLYYDFDYVVKGLIEGFFFAICMYILEFVIVFLQIEPLFQIGWILFLSSLPLGIFWGFSRGLRKRSLQVDLLKKHIIKK